MESQEDTRLLVDRAREGSREAFESLAERYRPRLEGLIRSRLGANLGTRVSADDVLQDVLLHAWGAIGGFEWRGDGAFLRWLGGILENVLRKEARRAARSARVRLEPRDDDPVSPSRALRREERFVRLKAALKRLSPDHQRVVELSRIEGLPVKEIAARMERSESAVKNLLLRAIKELKTVFGQTESFHLPDRTLKDDTNDV